VGKAKLKGEGLKMMGKDTHTELQEQIANMSELRWYAIYVRSRHEFIVRDALMQSGVAAFLPTVNKQRQWKDRKKIIEFPLFPGYLFVGLGDSDNEKYPVLKTRGVVRFMGRVPGEPEIVPFEQINALMRVVESGEGIDPYPFFAEGIRVRIKAGPLKGVEGILITRKGFHHLVLSIDILNRGVSVRVDAADVETL
jgi:transcription termination/antitermination protein NusG